jgi:hypothetical protein
MTIIEILLVGTGVYLLFGLLFAILFVIKGVDKVDKGAHGGSIGFRIIIIPGVMAFWPLLLQKWLQALKHKGNE